MRDTGDATEASDGSGSEACVERFLRQLRQSGLLRGVRRLLVAVSGGPDSTALACLLRACFARTPAGAPRAWLGHVHHGLRGEEADRDQEQVLALGAHLGWPVLLRRVEVAALARRRRISLEMAGREARRESFRGWAEELALDAVALAHHADDRRETLLLSLARGTGLRGLAGIPLRASLEGTGRPVWLVRPLLDWSPLELRRYLARIGRSYRLDSSNRSREPRRNRVRHELLPGLERVHPGARASLDRLAKIAAGLARDLDALARRAIEEAILEPPRPPRGPFRLDVAVLSRWPPSVRREVLVRIAAELRPGRPPPGSRASERLEALLAAQAGGSASLGGGLLAHRAGGVLAIAPEGSSPDVGPFADQPVPVGGGRVAWGCWRIEVDALPPPAWPLPPGEAAAAGVEWIDADRAGDRLRVRSRRPGDRFWPLGAPGHTGLDEFFRRRGVPPRERDGRPLLVAGEGGGEIVWVIGERIAHPFRIGSATRRAFRSRARREA